MQPHIRAIIAASVFALVEGGKVAGLYDHVAGRHLRIAAEARGEHLQGYDGDRNVRFGGGLPEIRDESGDLSLHVEIGDGTAKGYERRSSSHFSVVVTKRSLQLYDYSESAWFAFDVQVA